MTGPKRLRTEVAPDPPASGVGALAARGALALGARQVVVWLINFGSGIVLARLLAPADFGVFVIASFILTAFTVFGDGGLGASLIRQPDEPTLADYRRVFFVQQAVVIAVVLLCCATASLVVSLYALNESYAWFIRLMAIALLITSFQTISVIRLERRLAFGRIGMISAVESATFSAAAIAFAVAGAGVYSFGAALVAQALVGATLYLLASPWRIGWERPTRELRERLAFGIPYQGIGVVSLVKDSISPVFIGLLLGATQVGYVKWSQTLAAYALFAIQVLQRLLMPTFARLQGEPERLGRAVESILTACNALVAPVAVITLVLAEPLTHLVYGDTWVPALPIFYAFWCANVLVPTAAPIMALLNALGASRLAFSFALLWMVGTWGLGLPLSSGDRRRRLRHRERRAADHESASLSCGPAPGFVLHHQALRGSVAIGSGGCRSRPGPTVDPARSFFVGVARTPPWQRWRTYCSSLVSEQTTSHNSAISRVSGCPGSAAYSTGAPVHMTLRPSTTPGPKPRLAYHGSSTLHLMRSRALTRRAALLLVMSMPRCKVARAPTVVSIHLLAIPASLSGKPCEPLVP